MFSRLGPALRGRLGSERTRSDAESSDSLIRRLCRLDALDWIALGMYVGLAVWAGIALLEPPLSLLGATGPTFTLVVTVAILVFALSGAVGLAVDESAARGDRRLDVELPASIGLIGAWTTYNVIVVLIANGLGNPEQPPIRSVFIVLTWIVLIPVLIRLIVMLMKARRTFRAARVAREVGLVPEGVT